MNLPNCLFYHSSKKTSISLSSAQSHDLKTSLAGQIGRALAVFCVDEVIIFEDGYSGARERYNTQRQPRQGHDDDHGSSIDETTSYYTGDTDPSHFLTHLLSYVETPPHLRKHLFPLHPNLRTQGTLPSLDMPHHLRADEWCVYREGVTLEEEEQNGINGGSNNKMFNNKKKSKKAKPSSSEVVVVEEKSTIVEAGLRKKVIVPVHIPANTRVTLKFPSTTTSNNEDDQKGNYIRAQAISPTAPRTEAGYYWGYSIRRCSSLSSIFTECPYEEGYDLSFGMSERGKPVDSVVDEKSTSLSSFNHMVIVFGGVAGLEAACRKDDELRGLGVGPDEVERLFDHWINLLPGGQGSRTVRTEEALWIGLMGLRRVVEANRKGVV